jgi:hypothetical protein
MDKESLVNGLSRMISGGSSLEEAVRFLRALSPDEELLRAAILEYETKVKRIRSLVVPVALEAEDIAETWYAGPRDSDVFWPPVKGSLAQVLASSAVDSVDSASNKIVGYLSPPGASTIATRGLVMGYVQSGKTTNFIAVASKAADVGYRLIVVLSGVHNSLRWQTQDRLNRQLIDPVATQWFSLTDRHDFVETVGNVNFLLADPDKRVVAVVKKNPVRLAALNRWLDGASPETMAVCPILVIDDEADQASIDTGSNARRSRINENILHLLSGNRSEAVRKAAYVGYTASPFANLLINPALSEDLYPSDFIADLEQPDGYYGTEVIFGRDPVTPEEADTPFDGYDMVRDVPDEDVQLIRPPSRRRDRLEWTPSVSPTLGSAIRWFVLATAARRIRRTGVPHSTMLIHTTVSADAQERLCGPVQSYIRDLQTAVESGDPDLLEGLRHQWADEADALPSRVLGETFVPFDELQPWLGSVLGEIDVVVDNYRSTERLYYLEAADFDDPHRRTVVAIGGNTLSRGLTLEGLVASYFVRSATAYDTLLQMGRWFGYRRGYADLTRIWLSHELREWFIWLATVEHEIRLDIRRYEREHLTPREFAVRIRTHPKMAITAAAKMRHAVQAEVSYSGKRLQTILFNHKDRDWLRTNLGATRQLIRDALASGCRPEPLDGRTLIASVPVAAILRFLATYQFHKDAFDLKEEPLRKYIRAQNRLGDLESWNLVVMERPDQQLGTIDLGLPQPIGLMNRSRIPIDQAHANIKALMSKVDRLADQNIARQSIAELDDKELAERRPEGIGMLVIYPIQAYSPPRAPQKGVPRRVPLDAVDEVIGVGLVFPKATKGMTPQTYMTADLSNIEREEDDIDLDQVDAEDAVAAEQEELAGERGV